MVFRGVAVLALVGKFALALSSQPVQVACASTKGSPSWFPRELAGSVEQLSGSAAISPDGKCVAIAAGLVQQGMSTGRVWVLERSASGFVVRGDLRPPPLGSGMRFGNSLAFDASSSRLAIGAPGSPTRGRAFVYRRVGSTWVPEWSTTSIASGDSFGRSLALDGSGEMLVVGAPIRQNSGFTDYGAVETYRRQGTGWVLESTVTPATLPWARYLGSNIALSRDGAVLAASSHNGLWNDPVPSGAVYILERVGDEWVFSQRVQEPVAYSTGGFSTALALDAEGKTLAVGNFQDSRLLQAQGAVSIFKNTGASWVFDQVLLPQTPLVGTVFGRSIGISANGDRLRIGVPGHKVNGVSVGAIDEFELVGGAWQRIALHLAPTPTQGDAFGLWLASGSAIGDYWLAPDPFCDLFGPNAGAVHFYENRCLGPASYCTAQVNSLGCTPRVTHQGAPSASAASGFTIRATTLRNQQNGLLFYGVNDRAALPWLGGTLCVEPPLRRTPLSNSGGSPAPANDCSGELSLDFNAWAAVSNDPALFLGQRVRAQFYSRDMGAPANLNLTDAIEFYLEP